MVGAGRHQDGPIFRRSTAGKRWGTSAHAAVDQSDLEAALRDGRGGAGGVFSARTARRISDRGGEQGVALPEAMQQSQHRAGQQAASYYNEAERAQGQGGKAGALAGSTAFFEVRPGLR
jgi:hypothetical protein